MIKQVTSQAASVGGSASEKLPVSVGLPASKNQPTSRKHPSRLSPSGAAMFEQCPKRWRFRYIDKLPDPPGLAALVGTFAHRVLEMLLQEQPEDRTSEQAKFLAKSSWPDFAASRDYQKLGLDEQQTRDFKWRAWHAIEGLWALEDPATVKVEAVEVKVKSMLGDIPFTGIVDRVDREPDGGLVVTDYKSGRYPPVRAHQDRLRQVLMYAAAVEAYTGKMPAQARLYYLGQGVVDTPVTEEKLSEVVQELTITWHEILEACSKDVFEPRPGPLCGYCAYIQHCPEGQGYIEIRTARKAAEEESLLHSVRG